MEATEYNTKTRFSNLCKSIVSPSVGGGAIKAIRKHIPKGHLIAISSLSFLLAAFSLFPSQGNTKAREVNTLELPELSDNALDTEWLNDIEKELASQQPRLKQVQERVKSGDNLSRIFKRAGLSDRDMMELLQASKDSSRLANLLPGHKIAFGLDESNTLQTIHYTIDRLNSFSFTRIDDGFEFAETARKPDIQLAIRSAEIEHSLFTAGKEAQLDDKLVMELANIFGWDIDFGLDIRSGDSFKILYEESFLDGEKIGNGNILAAEFINRGQSFQAVRYVDKQGNAHYFTPKGESMRKAFLIAPLDFRRISSNFNPRRLHPIYKTLRPHRGTDYAAATGTPVWASGSGKVIASSYTKANGKYVVIQHGNNIQTKYLHLHKRFVKRGQRVKQRQRIGSVGSTGAATGPHLHYEFLLNGVHRNPRTIVKKLPKTKSIAKSELARFYSQTQPLMAELLDIGLSTTKLASADALNSKNL